MTPEHPPPESGQLATDWFWLVHDDHSGRPLLSPVHAGLGLGAALLAELLISGHVALREDRLTPVTRTPPEDVLAHQVFAQMLGEPQPLPIRPWLSFLSNTAREDIGRYLERSGMVRPQRSLLRRTTRWVSADVNVSGRPESRLRAVLIDRRGWTAIDAVLCGLSDATDLLSGVLESSEVRAARSAVPPIVQRLPIAIQTLLRETRAAVSAAVLSERR